MKDILKVATRINFTETKAKSSKEQLFQDLMIYGVAVCDDKGESLTKDYIQNPEKYKINENTI